MTRKILMSIIVLSISMFCYAYTGFSKQINTIIADGAVSSSELKELIDSNNTEYLLIDVRTEAEYKSGHIPNSILIPYTEIQDHTKRIPKNKLIIVYCRSGRRSGIAREKLLELGYKNVINFGGKNLWNYGLVE